MQKNKRPKHGNKAELCERVVHHWETFNGVVNLDEATEGLDLLNMAIEIRTEEDLEEDEDDVVLID